MSIKGYNKHKMNRIREKTSLAMLVLAVAGIVGLFATPLAYADCAGIETAIISCDSGDNGVLEIVKMVLQILTGLVGIAAVGALIYAGILYSSASGEQSQVQKAKTMIQNTIIGILLFGVMFLVGNWLVPGGVFSDNPSNWSQAPTSTQTGSTTGAGSGSAGSTGGSTGSNTGSGTGGSTGGGSSTGGTSGASGVKITAATYNIRASDLTSWDSTRANAILSYIKTVDIVGVQEGRSDSIPWLTTRLKTAGYARTSNEWARNVFWRTKNFTIVKQGQKQLDRGKDLVWVKLKERTSGKSFYFADVHLDVDSSANRTAELQTALKYMSGLMTDAPIVFVGDMNSERGSSQDKQIQRAGYLNAYDVATSKIHINYKTTLSGFKGGTSGTIDTSSTHQVDHIYIKGNLSVSRIEIVSHKGSDHLPVEADILLK